MVINPCSADPRNGQKHNKLTSATKASLPIYEEPSFVKGIKNGCPCIAEIRGTQGCALVGNPARAVGECRDVAKAQP